MKKPINPVALTFWLVAAVFIVGDVPIYFAIHSLANALHAEGSNVANFTWISVWSETRGALLGGGQLIGIGVLIELVDQIRWNGLPAEKQIVRPPIGAVIRRLRTIGTSS
jgi:hypothetical protein